MNRSRRIVTLIFEMAAIFKHFDGFFLLTNSTDIFSLKTCLQSFVEIDPSYHGQVGTVHPKKNCPSSLSKRRLFASLAHIITICLLSGHDNKLTREPDSGMYPERTF